MASKIPTKTFSGRADENKLKFADLICSQEIGMSFGQFCAGDLVNYIYETGNLPDLRTEAQANTAIEKMQNLIATYSLEKKSSFGKLVANMDDAGLSDFADSSMADAE